MSLLKQNAAQPSAPVARRAERSVREARALTEIVWHVNQSLELERVVTLVARHAGELLGARGCRVGMLESDEILIAATYGAAPEPVGGHLPLAALFAGEAIRRRAAVRTADLRANAARWPHSAVTAGPGRANAVAAPLLVGDRSIGALMVFGNDARDFDEDDEELLLALASHTAVAIENARLIQAQREERELAETSAAIARVALDGPSAEVAGTAILALLDQVVPSAGKGFSMLVDDVVCCFAAQGTLAATRGARIALQDSAARAALVDGVPQVVEHLRPAMGAGPTVAIPDQAMVFTPLVARDRVIGVLGAATTPGEPLAEGERAKLARLAPSVALALDALLMRQEERRLAEQLRQTEKLAALGELVAGVAHELNNPLTGISALAQLLLEDPLPAEQLDSVRLIRREADRAVAVIRDLLVFSRKTTPMHVPVDVNAIVEQTLRLRAYGLRSAGVSLATELTPGLPQVLGDAQRLQQVVLNLIANAEHAMRSSASRTLTVRTRAAAGQVVLTLSDTGVGMSSEMQRHIFEPFFTSKPAGEGTGLGLSVSYGIIQAHGGTISVESAPGHGTTFLIRLPVSSPSA